MVVREAGRAEEADKSVDAGEFASACIYPFATVGKTAEVASFGAVTFQQIK
jgi:hypothetical protein